MGTFGLKEDAPPSKSPVTHRQAERESFENLKKNRQPGGPDLVTLKTASEQRIEQWVKDIKTGHPDWVRGNALVPGGFFSRAAAKDIAKLHQLPKEYRAYIKTSLEAGGTRAGQAVAFLRSLHKVDPNIKKKVGFKTLSHVAGLWASAKRWGFGKEEFERLGAAKVYDLVARFDSLRSIWGKEFVELKKELESLVGNKRSSTLIEEIKSRAVNPISAIRTGTDSWLIDRNWQKGGFKDLYKGWSFAVTERLKKVKMENGRISKGDVFAVLALVALRFPAIAAPLVIAQAGDHILGGRAAILLRREFNRRTQDNIQRFSLGLALHRRFLIQLERDNPVLFE